MGQTGRRRGVGGGNGCWNSENLSKTVKKLPLASLSNKHALAHRVSIVITACTDRVRGSVVCKSVLLGERVGLFLLRKQGFREIRHCAIDLYAQCVSWNLQACAQLPPPPGIW